MPYDEMVFIAAKNIYQRFRRGILAAGALIGVLCALCAFAAKKGRPAAGTV